MARLYDSRLAVIAGLGALLVALPWWLIANDMAELLWAAVIGIPVSGLLMFAAVRQTRNWSGIVALCMIPVACIGVMEIVASAGEFNAGTSLALISIATFFAALDAGRRSGSQNDNR